MCRFAQLAALHRVAMRANPHRRDRALRAVQFVVAACATALVLPSAATAKPYFLDAYDRNTDAYAGPLKTKRLAKRVPYKLAVQGTFSLRSAQQLRENPLCGAPEPQPLFPTLGRPNGPVIGDAEFLFADIAENCAARGSLITGTVLEIRVGNKFKNKAPIGGQGDAPAADHLYTYAVKGKGKLARFRLYDKFTIDNYGRLRIKISRAVAADCANNGFVNWRYLDEATCLVATSR
jgi:hypothetical protein